LTPCDNSSVRSETTRKTRSAVESPAAEGVELAVPGVDTSAAEVHQQPVAPGLVAVPETPISVALGSAASLPVFALRWLVPLRATATAALQVSIAIATVFISFPLLVSPSASSDS
jgi:hypothetical protein